MKTAMPVLLVALTFLFVLAMALVSIDKTLSLYQPGPSLWINRTFKQDLLAQGAEDEKPDRPFACPRQRFDEVTP